MSLTRDETGGLPLWAPHKQGRRVPMPGTQNFAVLGYIRAHGSITDMDAYDRLRIRRLAARIMDLKDMGWPIVATMERHDGGRHARYSLGER